MRKFILINLLILILGVASECQALQVYNLISRVKTEKDSIAAPKLTVTYDRDNSEYLVTLEIEEIEIVDDDVYTGCKFLKIPGFGQTTQSGTASLPTKGEPFVVPQGKVPVIDIVQSTPAIFRGAVAPAREPAVGIGITRL